MQADTRFYFTSPKKPRPYFINRFNSWHVQMTDKMAERSRTALKEALLLLERAAG